MLCQVMLCIGLRFLNSLSSLLTAVMTSVRHKDPTMTKPIRRTSKLVSLFFFYLLNNALVTSTVAQSVNVSATSSKPRTFETSTLGSSYLNRLDFISVIVICSIIALCFIICIIVGCRRKKSRSLHEDTAEGPLVVGRWRALQTRDALLLGAYYFD